MKVRLISIETYYSLETGQIYHAGKDYEVTGKEASTLLSAMYEGKPFFRQVLAEDDEADEVSVVKPQRKGKVSVVRKPRVVTPSETGETDSAEGITV